MKKLAATWCHLETTLHTDKLSGFETKRAYNEGHVFFLLCSSHASQKLLMIEHNKLREIDYFLPKKFAREAIYVPWCRLLYLLNKNICWIEIHSTGHEIPWTYRKLFGTFASLHFMGIIIQEALIIKSFDCTTDSCIWKVILILLGIWPICTLLQTPVLMGFTIEDVWLQ